MPLKIGIGALLGLESPYGWDCTQHKISLEIEIKSPDRIASNRIRLSPILLKIGPPTIQDPQVALSDDPGRSSIEYQNPRWWTWTKQWKSCGGNAIRVEIHSQTLPLELLSHDKLSGDPPLTTSPKKLKQSGTLVDTPLQDP